MLVSAFVMTSCGHDSPRDELTTNGGQTGSSGAEPSHGTGQRPGLGEHNNFDRELNDDVLRVKGADIDLRYDRGGILFISCKDGRLRVIDLDGADEVIVEPGVEGADSVMTGCTLTAGGLNVELQCMKMMRRSDGRTWYKATDADENVWVMVLPK